MYTVWGFTDAEPIKRKPLATFDRKYAAIDYVRNNMLAVEVVDENDDVVYTVDEDPEAFS